MPGHRHYWRWAEPFWVERCRSCGRYRIRGVGIRSEAQMDALRTTWKTGEPLPDWVSKQDYPEPTAEALA